jgi:hypothetical protein
MGLDLATILAVMGTVWVGDALSLSPGFSIGGETPAVDDLLDNLFGLLGKTPASSRADVRKCRIHSWVGEPRGLIGSHNIIEADSSNTRDDLYVTGNNYALDLTLFSAWYATAQDGVFSVASMADRAKLRFDQSIQTNPDFYYGPFTGAVARNAGYIFAQRFFSNYSADSPDGVLSKLAHSVSAGLVPWYPADPHP